MLYAVGMRSFVKEMYTQDSVNDVVMTTDDVTLYAVGYEELCARDYECW